MRGRRAAPVRLSPLVRVVLAPNPSPMTLEGTNTYLIGERPAIVLDPGPSDEGHLDRVLAEAGEVALVLLSHRHRDHAAAAGRFAEMAGAPVAAFPGARGDAIGVADGEEVGTGDARLRAVATPGHSSDHLCFLLIAEGALFTGDHVLGSGTTVVAHPDGDMAAYLGSLERIRELGPRRMYPGHGPVIEEPAPVLDYYVRHRLEREGQVLDALEAGCRTVAEIVARIYADVDPALHPAAALTVRAHLAKLAREGRAPGDIE